ncbi:helix-hairpin-helix domain-containing protein [Ligilactobacillus faecis]|uniref:helix-hairpin-helix domain-containing protein n=1 Tax=Ligilactobacillus faecis TaxID=762833 RepID=UPI0024685D56|nr:helix-hairpin-helix domain-containing protein [Ligilactobacillus faecis]WGN89405.1 helix-hairpin-helix domain-containing protein [Ligilactobacillus faecis]
MYRKKDMINELWQNFITKHKVFLLSLGSVLMVVLSGLAFVWWNKPVPKENFLGPTQTTKIEHHRIATKAKYIFVDVKGAVKVPGLYKILASKRVGDAIALAGGVNAEADSSQVNFAKKLSDQMVIYVSKQGEQTAQTTDPTKQAPASTTLESSTSEDDQTKFDLNQVDKQQLMQIDGIGEKKAEQIILYRKQHQGFKQLAELKNVTGIGEKLYQVLSSRLKV